MAKSSATKSKTAATKATKTTKTTAKTARAKGKSAARDTANGKAEVRIDTASPRGEPHHADETLGSKTDVPNVPIDAAWVRARTAGMKGEDVALGVPLNVFLGESLDCAKFLRTYWKPEVRDGKVVVPGMESAAKSGDGESAFGLHTADEIVALHNAVQAAHTEYLLATKMTKNAQKLMARGAELLDQWTAALEWAFDDGVQDDKDAQFAAVRASNAGHEDTIDGMAMALADFGGLVQKYKRELTGVLDFDPATIDEGLQISMQLRQINARLENNPEAREAKARRNNALALLQRRVARVRKAAQLVFRGKHAEIARKVTSAYQRRARALARRAQAKAETTP